MASFPGSEDGRGSPSPTKRFERASPQHQQQHQQQRQQQQRQQQQQQQDLSGSHRDGHEDHNVESPFSRSPPTSTLPRMGPVVPQQLPPDAPPTEASKRQWTGPGKTNTVVNGLTFRSDFDSGNLMKVVALSTDQEGADGVYQLWTAR